MPKKKLTYIFMVYIVFAILTVMLLNLGWNIKQQQRISERALLDKAEIITDKLLSMRSFIADKQDRINFDSAGNFEFKGLNPAAVGIGVGSIFNERTTYSVKQTRINPRNPINEPDLFEKIRLTELKSNQTLSSYWGRDSIDGKRVFRYLRPLYMEQSCLTCHGSPAGEIDISGHPREGLQLGDFAGAISVIIPAEEFYQQLNQNIFYHLLFTLILLPLTIGLLYFLQRKLITLPLEKLTSLTEKIKKGDFELKAGEYKVAGRGEIKTLEINFLKMIKKLEKIYKGLEEEVKERTSELEKEKDKLTQINFDLAKLNKIQSDFLASISHELRTPLTCVLAFAELLENPTGISEQEQKENILDIKESAQDLLIMVTNLLDTAKLEVGKIKLRKIHHNIPTLISALVRSFTPLAKKKNIIIKTDLEKNLPELYCDLERVRQILTNLLGNAIKFTPPQGLITITVRWEHPPEGQVFFYITDTGPGISLEEQPFIFDRFKQIDTPLTRQSSGTGLGLHLARGLATMHGGEIAIKDSSDKGTTFYLSLPVTERT